MNEFCYTIFHTSLLIRAVCDLIGIPEHCTVCSLIYCHKSYIHGNQLSLRRTCAACIFLACKVEEYPLKNSDLVNVINVLILKSMFHRNIGYWKKSREIMKRKGWELLVGNQYYETKTQLLVDEKTILKLLAFKIITVQPHKILYNFAKSVSASKSIVILSTCLLNDLLIYTNLIARIHPSTITASCLSYGTDVILAKKHPRSHHGIFNQNFKRKDPYGSILTQSPNVCNKRKYSKHEHDWIVYGVESFQVQKVLCVLRSCRHYL